MQVYKVSVRFRRQRQPRDYEAAEAEVGYEVQVEDGEDHAATTRALIAEAAGIVYETVGLQKAAERVSGGEPAATEEKAEAKKAAKGGKKGPKKAAKTEDERPAEPKGEEPEGKFDVSDADLQQAAAGAARRVGSEKVKEVMGEFGLARLGELDRERRPEFVERMDALE